MKSLYRLIELTAAKGRIKQRLMGYFERGPDARKVADETNKIAPFGVVYVVVPPEKPKCEYFLLCTRDVAKFLAHPILGRVPTCHRCAKKMEAISRR